MALHYGGSNDDDVARVLPPSVLDALFASLQPLVTRLTEVYADAQTAWAIDSAKAAWIGALNQASKMLQDASIDGQLGQRIAMGDVSPRAWSATVESAADLVEFVAKEIGLASYSIPRVWREIVIPTAVQTGQAVKSAAKTVLTWGPFAAIALGIFWLGGSRR